MYINFTVFQIISDHSLKIRKNTDSSIIHDVGNTNQQQISNGREIQGYLTIEKENITLIDPKKIKINNSNKTIVVNGTIYKKSLHNQ